jgi:hypothetical protein
MLWRLMDHANLAEALVREGRDDAALAACEMGMTQTANSAPLYRVRALIRASAGDMERALEDANRALELAPDDLNALTTMGNVLSWSGNLEAALPFVRWNWIDEERSCEIRFAQTPQWTGGDLGGRSIFVAHEQGYGDAIHMARYLPLLRERGARVVVESAPATVELLRSVSGVDDVVERGTSAHAAGCDTYVRMMTLPSILGIAPDATVPYLQVEPERIARWNAFVQGDGIRVGLAWAGNPKHTFDAQRSMLAQEFEPLKDIRGVRWISLMQHESDFKDLGDVAAVISQIDLVISVDTAAAHLAGALGRPVWTMLARRPDWRWSGSGDRTVWYPTMRLFRETAPAWSTVIPRVRSALAKFVSGFE